MDIVHTHSQRVAFTPAHIQVACDGVFLALPLTRTSVGVWSLQDLSYKPLEMEGHSKILTSLALGHVASPKCLVSAAEDYIIIWNLQQARQHADKGDKIKGRVIGTTLGYVQYSSFSPDDNLVAICVGFEVIVLHAKYKDRRIATLEGHNGTVTAAEFCPHYTFTLVSISDDRTFKIWNLEDLTLVYQSPIITASPFLCLAMSVHEPHMAVGAADGMVRVYDLTDGNGFRCLHQLDVDRFITRQKEQKLNTQTETKKGPVTISSRPSWKQADSSTSPRVADVQENMIETGHSVLGLYFTFMPPGDSSRTTSAGSHRLPFLQNKDHIMKELLTSAPMLMVGTTSGLLQVNTRSKDTCCYVDFQDPIKCLNNLDSDEKVLNAAGSVIFGQGADLNKIWCIVGSPFQNVVHMLQWGHAGTQGLAPTLGPAIHTEDALEGLQNNFATINLPTNTDDTLSEHQGSQELTVLSSTPMLENSVLRAEYTPKRKDSKEMKPRDFVKQSKKGKIIDNQPLTFKTRVKSSGYTAAPRMTMFTPCTDFSPKPKKSASQNGLKSLSKQMREYPVTSSPPTNMATKVDVAERPTAINRIKITDEGQSVACALANKSALVFGLPLSDKGTAYTGHNHVVRSVQWSHCGSRMLTSSDDKTAALWVKGQSDPVVTFNKMLHSGSTGLEVQTKDKDNKPFTREVAHAQFYYMDKFILLCSGNKLYMYKYHVDPCKNDIKRYLSNNKYRLVHSWPAESQQLTALSSINTFLSYIVLCAGSNKSLNVFDMNVGQPVRHMTEAHTRPVHAICQNEGSQYVTHPSSVYDLFATAAAGDCIKLWDLRTNSCVRRYEGHLNRVHPCGLDISPCGRFIASGSEDKSCYIFDIRAGTYLHKLTGQTDVVTDVAFHPLHPQLFTASLDGKLQMYNNR